VYRKSEIERFMKADWFRKATTEAAGPDATRRGIAAERWEELREFRATHPLKRATVAGVGWDYIASGEGDEALLLLPGGAMVGESHFTRIAAFENGYRVIAPSYASVSTAAELLDGLAGVLDAEGVLKAHVLGPSYGGPRGAVLRAPPSRAREDPHPREHVGAAAGFVVALEDLFDAAAFRAGRMAADLQGAHARAVLLRRAERAAGGSGVLARLPARAHLSAVEG
jgi:pimeloyl-ACP methyl ester carboxylesterase